MPPYGPFFQSLLNKEVDIDTDTLKVMLTTSAYTPNQDTHRYKSDVTNEITGTGYTAGGATVTSPTVTYTGASNLITFDAADTSWSSASFTARTYVLYDSTPATDATRPLIQYETFGSDQTVTSSTFTIVWNASGIFTITVA